MCFGINNYDDAWKCYGPGFTSTAFDMLIDFRNPERAPIIPTGEKGADGLDKYKLDPNFVPQGSCELFARRFAAEIGFALLSIAVVIECVVRMVFSLVAALPCILIGCCLQNKDLAATPLLMLFASGIGLLDLPLRSLVALVKNVCEERLHFNDLALCEITKCS